MKITVTGRFADIYAKIVLVTDSCSKTLAEEDQIIFRWMLVTKRFQSMTRIVAYILPLEILVKI